MDDNKELEALLQQVEESGLRETNAYEIEWIPTGIASLDMSTGGGFPRQRVSILQGEEHSGKTLIALSLIANAQRQGGRAAFIDAEHALTPDFARLLGVQWDDLVVDRPKTLDQAYDLLRTYGKSGLFDVIAFDSVTALVPASELDASASDSQSRAAIPQMHSKELPKLIASLHKRTAVVLLNQMRTNPNPPAWMRGGGTLLYAPGGKALRHASSLTLMVKPGQIHKHGDQRVGQRIKTESVKNKCSAPHQKAEFDLIYATGLDLLTSVIETALEMQVIRQKSSFFYVDVVDTTSGEVAEEKKFNGRAALEQFLRDNPTVVTNIQRQMDALEPE